MITMKPNRKKIHVKREFFLNPIFLKSQISAEFFIFIGLAFLISIAFAAASLEQLNDFRAKKDEEAVKDLALKLQKELITASAVEDGYVRVFELPDKLDGINYSLTTKNSTITVESKNSLYVASIPNAIGNFSKGINTINKTGGVIYLSGKPSSFTYAATCQSAQDNGLCSGLDLVYGTGYRSACCSEHGLCC